MGWWQKLTGQEEHTSLRPQTATAGRGETEPRDGAPITDAETVSKILGPADFAAVGVPGAGSPRVNADMPDSAYLVYAGRSGATGGIEFDVFFSGSPESVFANATGEMTNPMVPAHQVGADEAVLSLGQNNGRGGKWAGIAVRKGRLVFAVSIPDSPQAESQLVALAKLVIERAKQVQVSSAV